MSTPPPSGWDDVAVADFGDIVGGGTPSRATPSFWNGTIPWVTPSEITALRGKYVWDTQERITSDGLAGSAAKLLPAGSVVVTTRATLGEAAIATVPLTTNQGFKSIIPNAETDSLFAYYRIRTLKSEMVRLASGTTFLEISKADFSRIRTHRPKPPEQSRIALVLDTVDEAIAKTEAVIAKLRHVRAGLLHDLLTRGLDAHGQLRDPIANPEQFQASPLGQIPKEWEVTSLGKALSMQAGEMLTSEDISVAGTYPVFGGNGIRGYTSRYTHDGGYAIIGRQGALCGNIVLACGKFFATEHAVVCTPLKKISAGWLACYLAQMNLNRFSESSAQPGLSVHKISFQKIALPGFDEQTAIEAQLNAVDDSLKAEENEKGKLHQLKSGLMTDLLTGRVRVPETK
jgi:type I restriction enzyme S subunit